MTILLILLGAAFFTIVGIIIGVHNAKSNVLAPLAVRAQDLGRKAVKAAKAPKRK
jgi:hypothetical protein